MGVYVKGNPKEGEYKLIKTTDGFVLDGKDIAYACIEIADEVWENEKYKLIRMTQEARINKAMAERRADDNTIKADK